VPVADLLGKRERTDSGVEVQAPTVRSFFRALEVFGTEIAIVRQAAAALPEGIAPEIAVAPFLVSPEDGRLAYVLEGLVADSDYLDAAIVPTIVRFVKPLAARINALLGPADAESMPQDDDVDPGVLLVLGCAERYKIDPMIVMHWPLGLFLDVIHANSRPPKDANVTGREVTGEMFDSMMPKSTDVPPVIDGATYPEASVS